MAGKTWRSRMSEFSLITDANSLSSVFLLFQLKELKMSCFCEICTLTSIFASSSSKIFFSVVLGCFPDPLLALNETVAPQASHISSYSYPLSLLGLLASLLFALAFSFLIEYSLCFRLSLLCHFLFLPLFVIANPNSRWVKCDRCQKWYHGKCVGITKETWEEWDELGDAPPDWSCGCAEHPAPSIDNAAALPPPDIAAPPSPSVLAPPLAPAPLHVASSIQKEDNDTGERPEKNRKIIMDIDES